MIFVTNFNRLRFIPVILAVISSQLILWLLLILTIMIQAQWMERRMELEHGWVDFLLSMLL